MKHRSKILSLQRITPLFLFSLILLLLYQALHASPNPNMNTRAVNTTIPSFALYDLMAPGETLTEQLFLGQTSILHVWASWCAYCHQDIGLWQNLAETLSVPIYGLDYKDDISDAQDWLMQHGNPFQKNIYDPRGELGQQLKIAGTPETFVIDKFGTIVYQVSGPITQVWVDETLKPLLNSLEVPAT